MSLRATTFALGFLAVGSTAAGLVLPWLSEQQIQTAFCAAGCAVVLTVIAAHCIGSRP
ncbi:hypothetical protein [Myxococcus virescens]|uniref:Uncharacterized protein n=1 Tax=Myxococcus virescens TaxID=83456 RepID=A0A511HM16_9BACT|nr:hypothetical protein [Myxococcus virescens]GEL74651.1 hypothetical protein MVI01_64350 [Myxococcus virescens]SDE55033.1 hypothetical protein SAMN04488504_108178 [Myxococcus virescens]